MNRNKLRKKDSDMPTFNERLIWRFYEWAVIIAPVILMLSHWFQPE